MENKEQEIDFSVILNSRGRVPLLDNLLKSIENTADRPNRLEVLIAADLDDLETVEYSKKPQNLNVRWFINERPESLNASLTMLAREAKGTLIFNQNDDMVLLTKGFDKIILDKFEDFKRKNGDGIAYIAVEDNSVDKSPGKDYASFPILSKETVEVTSIFMYPAFVGLGGDSGTWKIFKELQPFYDRILKIPEVKIDHLGHNNLITILSGADTTALEMRQKSWAANVNPFTYNVQPEVEKLKNYIQSKNKSK